jgi:hypothetical protein
MGKFMIAANDNKPTRNYGASPHTGRPLQAIRKLAKEDWRAALALYLEVQQAPAMPLHNEDSTQSTAGDDVQTWEAPASEVSFETLTETPYSAAKNDGARAETTTTERPSERDLMRNIGWIEWPWCGRAESAERRGDKAPKANGSRSPAIGWAMRLPDGKVVQADGRLMPAPQYDGYRRYMGGLVYSALNNVRKSAPGGMLVSFIGSNGKDFSPKEDRQDRGPAKHRSAAATAAYLRLRPTTPSPLHAAQHQRQMQQPGWFDSGGVLDEKAAARSELAAMMANYRGNVTKCPTGIARSAWCLGGISNGSETKSTAMPLWDAPAQRGLSPLLEAVATGANLRELGYVAGNVTSEQRAAKVGKAALLAEAGRLIEQAAARGEPLPIEPDETAKAALAKLEARDTKAAAWQSSKKARLAAANDNQSQKVQAA